MENKDRLALGIILAFGAVIALASLFLLLILIGLARLSSPFMLFSLGTLFVLATALAIVALKANALGRLKMKRFVSYLDVMHEEDFLDYVARLLGNQGCKTTIVQGCVTGIEIIAEKKGKQYATMAVRSKSPLTEKIVVMASDGSKTHGCFGAMIVTNSSFSDKAKDLARASRIKLVDGEMLKTWAN